MLATVDIIKNKIRQEKDTLQRIYEVEDLGIFGSVARGDDTATSDIDMLVKFTRPIGMFKFIELEEYLSQLLGKKVDLVTPKALKPAIKEEILQEVIYV